MTRLLTFEILRQMENENGKKKHLIYSFSSITSIMIMIIIIFIIIITSIIIVIHYCHHCYCLDYQV